MSYELRLREAGGADVLRRLPPDTKKSIRAALRRLVDDPQGATNALDIHSLRVPPGTPATYRLRVGDWRIVYFLDGRTIRVFRIFERDEGYRWLEE